MRMSNLSLLIVATFLVTMLGGCVPMVSSFYETIGPGHLYGSGCSSGRNNRGFEVADGFGLMVYNTDNGTDTLTSIEIYLFVGPGHTVQLPTWSVQVTAKDSDIAKDFEIRRIVYYEFKKVGDRVAILTPEVPFSTPLVGAKDYDDSILRSRFQTYRRFHAKIDTGGLRGQSFRLHFPSVLLDGKPIQIPDVRFEYGRNFEWVGVMC